MVNITKAQELTSVRAALLACIVENITDPLTGQEARSSTTHWIFEGFPNPAKLGKPPGSAVRVLGESPRGWKFPIVVMDFPNTNTENATVDSSKQFIEDPIIIETHARSRLQAYELAQEIKNILETTVSANLNAGTLHFESLVASPTLSDFIGGSKFYTKAIEYTFKRFD